ncbi:unnamed protein product [Tetraodon nigroviridis]|uniref:(spotted green pufferfish) hypothetical protein n=1 Tax=Tetraodon nigroviridis TaxID=99883 RepID=Q4RNC2_TETNG|nr:unnamed protein product [Tetraodon nigroviridis]
MGARLTMFCQYYLRNSREKKVTFSRRRSGGAPRRPEAALTDSSDSDGVWGPQGPASPGVLQIQGTSDSPAREGLDRELQTFISMRDQTDQATEEWEKLNYDIHTLRYAQREVHSRWKKILLQLGETPLAHPHQWRVTSSAGDTPSPLCRLPGRGGRSAVCEQPEPDPP